MKFYYGWCGWLLRYNGQTHTHALVQQIQSNCHFLTSICIPYYTHRPSIDAFPPRLILCDRTKWAWRMPIFGYTSTTYNFVRTSGRLFPPSDPIFSSHRMLSFCVCGSQMFLYCFHVVSNLESMKHTQKIVNIWQSM